MTMITNRTIFENNLYSSHQVFLQAVGPDQEGHPGQHEGARAVRGDKRSTLAIVIRWNSRNHAATVKKGAFHVA